MCIKILMCKSSTGSNNHLCDMKRVETTNQLITPTKLIKAWQFKKKKKKTVHTYLKHPV